MNLDLSIARMAFREAPTLGEAQVLVAKKRADLEHELTLKQVTQGSVPTRDAIERTVADMEQLSDQKVKSSPHAVDKIV